MNNSLKICSATHVCVEAKGEIAYELLKPTKALIYAVIVILIILAWNQINR